jgi:hypothetical protein
MNQSGGFGSKGFGMATNYEVHTLKGGTWQIDSTYSQRDAAIDTAKQLYGEKRFEAIKVVKDDFDPRTNQGKEIVIYDTTKPQPEKKGPPPKEEAKPAVAEKKANVDFKGGHIKAKPASSGTMVKYILLLGVVLLGGIAALFGISQLAGVLNKL